MRLRPIPFAVGIAWLLAGCASVTIGKPTPAPGPGPLDVPQPTASQIGVGANPNPSTPRMYPFVAQVNPPGRGANAKSYEWLEDVHSKKTRQWISAENRVSEQALAAIPQRVWIETRLAQLQGAGRTGAADDDVVERVSYLGPDGTALPMEIAYRRGSVRDGNRPALLTVYRAARKPPAPLLQPMVLVWLEMGGVYARAEVRDGLAPVPAPRGAGTLPDRSIALPDLLAAARHLVDQHYTRRARLGIYGHGFAGLIAGAALTRAPDAFGLAMPTGTWAHYRDIPSGNCFPPTLVTTAMHGGNFRPWQGYELAAALQAEQICRHPILMRVYRDEDPADPTSARRRTVDELAFAAQGLGMPPP